MSYTLEMLYEVGFLKLIIRLNKNGKPQGSCYWDLPQPAKSYIVK